MYTAKKRPKKYEKTANFLLKTRKFGCILHFYMKTNNLKMSQNMTRYYINIEEKMLAKYEQILDVVIKS